MIGLVVFLIVCILFFLFTLGIVFFIYNLKIRSWKRQNPEYAVIYFEKVTRNDYPKENIIGTMLALLLSLALTPKAMATGNTV